MNVFLSIVLLAAFGYAVLADGFLVSRERYIQAIDDFVKVHVATGPGHVRRRNGPAGGQGPRAGHRAC
jgi:hypothetical protein